MKTILKTQQFIMKIKKSLKIVQNASEFKIGELYMFYNRAADGGYFDSDDRFGTAVLIKNGSILLFIGSEITQSDFGRVPATISTKFLFENKILWLKIHVKTHKHENFIFYKVDDDFC